MTTWRGSTLALLVSKPASSAIPTGGPHRRPLVAERCVPAEAPWTSAMVVFAADLPETVGGKVLKYKLRAQHAGHYHEID